MKRREFIALLGGVAASWPTVAATQQPKKMRRIAMLNSILGDDPEGKARTAAFLDEFHKLGWTENSNFQIDFRSAAGNSDRVRAYVRELVESKPDLILAVAPPALTALKHETNTIPIVFLQIADPVGGGYVQSLATPGGNVTGFTNFEYSIAGKWLELLKQAAPHIAEIAVLYNPNNPTAAGYLRVADAVAPSFGLRMTKAAASNATQIEAAIDAFAARTNGGLVILPDASTLLGRELIVTLESRYKLPAIHPFRVFAESGGLISYAPDPIAQFRQAASYVDRILKGEKPADLPVQAPTKFELIINVKTAKALGLTLPESLLATADEVIE